MASVTMHGNALTTVGELPAIGAAAPDFELTGTDMKPVKLADSAGKVRIISLVPSIDTGVCSIETGRFNHELSSLPENVIGYTISVDTPFAQKRWCAAEGADKMILLSDFKNHRALRDYGVYIEDAGISARAVLIVDGDGKVAYTQLVPEIASEPNYEEVLNKAREIAA